MTSVSTPGNAWSFLTGRKPGATDRASDNPVGTPATSSAAKKVRTASPVRRAISAAPAAAGSCA